MFVHGTGVDSGMMEHDRQTLSDEVAALRERAAEQQARLAELQLEYELVNAELRRRGIDAPPARREQADNDA